VTYTTGTLLGGKLHYRQTAHGHRSGLEPILLAASIPAQYGDRVIEAGTGAGAGLLCLGYRVPGIEGIGIERDPILAALAADNFRVNAMPYLATIAADIGAMPLSGAFDHAFANPPWRSMLDTPSPDHARQAAHRAPAGLLAEWIVALGKVLKPRGTLTFILPAASVVDCVWAMNGAHFGSCRVVPLWPRAGRAAKLVIVQSKKHSRGPVGLMPGLILHDSSGFAPAVHTLLCDGVAFPSYAIRSSAKPSN
jgi:tRNA1(Val) A37 N6-methylase TrmN6